MDQKWCNWRITIITKMKHQLQFSVTNTTQYWMSLCSGAGVVWRVGKGCRMVACRTRRVRGMRVKGIEVSFFALVLWIWIKGRVLRRPLKMLSSCYVSCPPLGQNQSPIPSQDKRQERRAQTEDFTCSIIFSKCAFFRRAMHIIIKSILSCARRINLYIF